MSRIPRILHYCWFGGQPLPAEAERMLATWQRHCPDFELRRWDESTFELASFPFAEEAHRSRKYAFVSDVARGYALWTQGGVYLDTDVELVGGLEPFLGHEAFFGFEHDQYVATSTMGAVAGHPLMEAYLDHYRDRSFLKPDGAMDLTTNVQLLTALLEKHGLRRNGLRQEVNAGVVCYPETCFSPYDYVHCRDLRTAETVAIHHYAQTWLPRHVQWRRAFKRWVLGFLPGRS